MNLSIYLLMILNQDPQLHQEVLTRQEQCFIKVMCETKHRIRYGKDEDWSPEYCDQIGRQIIKSAKAHNFTPEFLLSFAIHESDMREKVTRATVVDHVTITSKTKIQVAHDGGLFGVRCIHLPIPLNINKDPNTVICKNGYVKKFTLAQVLNPFDSASKEGKIIPGNVELGASILDALKTERSCKHKGHPWYTHYNAGTYVGKKSVFYGHSIASIYTALAEAMGVEPIDIKNIIIYVDKKGRNRPANHPITSRHKELYARIVKCKGACSQFALLN